MFFKTLLIALCCSAAVVAAPAQDQGRRIELEESLQSRYRITVIGGGFMGVHGENTIRKAGGIVVLVREGLYGAYNRGNLASNGIRDGKAELYSGDKDVTLERGEKFYVTAAHVGSDVVTLGLLSVRMIPSGGKTAQVWCTANFFFTKEILSQGDIGKVYSAMDQWFVQEGTNATATPSRSPAPATQAPAVSSGKPVDLTAGMARDQVVGALGAPLQDVAFGEHRWLTYSGITVTLDEGKLTSVERNAQALVPVRISSDPTGADVYLEGSFVSSTPAVLRLQAGTYKVAVKMSGYSDWEREVKILPGAEVNLTAKLSK